MNAIGSVLLDTSVVIAYFRKDPALHGKIENIDDVYLPLAVLGELLYGARKSTQTRKMLEEVRSFSSGCILLLPDEATADLYGQIKANLSVAGKAIPENDIWIAAAALQHHLPLGSS